MPTPDDHPWNDGSLEQSLRLQEIEKLNSIAAQCDALEDDLGLILAALQSGAMIHPDSVQYCIVQAKAIRSTAMCPRDFGDHECEVPLL